MYLLKLHFPTLFLFLFHVGSHSFYIVSTDKMFVKRDLRAIKKHFFDV